MATINEGHEAAKVSLGRMKAFFDRRIIVVLSPDDRMMVGTSVSHCPLDIAEGRIPLSRVEKIVGDTCYRDETEWREAIRKYRKGFWKKNPDGAERVLRLLLKQGKIEQPRLKDFRLVSRMGMRYWVTTGEEIKYAKG